MPNEIVFAPRVSLGQMYSIWHTRHAASVQNYCYSVRLPVLRHAASVQKILLFSSFAGIAARAMPCRSAFVSGVDEAGEAVDVAAEAGTIMEEAVKPVHVGIDELDDIADVEHGEECTRSDNCPRP